MDVDCHKYGNNRFWPIPWFSRIHRFIVSMSHIQLNNWCTYRVFLCQVVPRDYGSRAGRRWRYSWLFSMRHLMPFSPPKHHDQRIYLLSHLSLEKQKDPKRSKLIDVSIIGQFQPDTCRWHPTTGRARTAAAVPSEVVTRRRAQGKIAEATWQWRGENCRENMRKPWAVMSICCLKTHAKTDHVGDLK